MLGSSKCPGVQAFGCPGVQEGSLAGASFPEYPKTSTPVLRLRSGGGDALDPLREVRSVGRNDGDVSDLPAGARRLAVKMQVRARDLQNAFGGRRRTEHVPHRRHAARGRRSERQARNRPEVILELAGFGALDGPVARVVDARRNLIHEQLAGALEQLDREHADVFELLGDLARVTLRGLLERGGRARRRRDGPAENAAQVQILGQRIERHLAAPSAGRDKRYFPLEIDESFQDKCVRGRGKVPGDRFALLLGPHYPLVLAIVPEPARLHNGRQTDEASKAPKIARRIERDELRGRNAERSNQRLFRKPVLELVERHEARIDENIAAQRQDRFCRHVLELERRDIQTGGEIAQCRAILVTSNMELADMAGRRCAVRIEKSEPEAHRYAGQGEHSAKLAAAEHADLHDDLGSGSIITLSVCSARNLDKRSRIAGCPFARMAAARSAALTAPARPIASVPTGTPAGIWTMESSESRPLSACDSTGTPRTGRMVLAAAMPGRWAAPPAPAMMTCRPRDAAEPAYSNSRSGVRCAETIRTSNGTSRDSRVRAACAIVSQSDRDPMMRPTSGLAGSGGYSAIRVHAAPPGHAGSAEFCPTGASPSRSALYCAGRARGAGRLRAPGCRRQWPGRDRLVNWTHYTGRCRRRRGCCTRRRSAD